MGKEGQEAIVTILGNCKNYAKRAWNIRRAVWAGAARKGRGKAGELALIGGGRAEGEILLHIAGRQKPGAACAFPFYCAAMKPGCNFNSRAQPVCSGLRSVLLLSGTKKGLGLARKKLLLVAGLRHKTAGSIGVVPPYGGHLGTFKKKYVN